jgi:hypothetical protein
MNEQFLKAIFGVDYHHAHVTDFTFPPDNIPKEQQLMAWKGDYFCNYKFAFESNQYFCISLFFCDEEHKARRRKALFRRTHCIVLDDVKEKLSEFEAHRLPKPSWILETSQGSEQWGYILTTPCENRIQVENLLDGLVANGLAPSGSDPGMKGVTRYVRLPDGVNNKTSKQFHKCDLKVWEPGRKVTMEQLAQPFNVNLNAARREVTVQGAAAVPDHPLLDSGLSIKEVRSDGRFDITCPWVDEHTNQDDSGTAIFTNQDGSLGFKCHHGHCQDKTGRHLLEYLGPEFTERYKVWQTMRELPLEDAQVQEVEEEDALNVASLIADIRRLDPTTREAREKAGAVLKVVDCLPKMEQVQYLKDIQDVMRWSKPELAQIINDLRNEWYKGEEVTKQFYQEVFHVGELNQFYDWRKRVYYSPDAFVNSFCDQDAEVKSNALTEGMVDEDGVKIGNVYVKSNDTGVAGDCGIWLNHFDKIGWGEYREHMLNWMAYTVQFPQNKINHMLLLGGGEGVGKDFLLFPLIKAMGKNARIIGGENLLSQFNSYLVNTKYLHINEIELGDHRDSARITPKLKPLATAPPNKLEINQKGIKEFEINNLVNCTMATNSLLPFKQHGISRRYFAVWSDVNMRGRDGNMLQEWYDYWIDAWAWMNDNYRACIHYLETKDVSRFNPYAAPPMTEFLREIQDNSKPATQQTLEALLESRYGHFNKDVVTSEQLIESIRAAETFKPELLYTKASYFTPVKLGMVLKEIGCMKLYATVKGRTKRCWSLRNHDANQRLTMGERGQQVA